MSPKRGTGCSGSVGGRELQALLDSADVPIADKDDAAGQIPWRTSRRLQAATLRSLVKERQVSFKGLILFSTMVRVRSRF